MTEQTFDSHSMAQAGTGQANVCARAPCVLPLNPRAGPSPASPCRAVPLRQWGADADADAAAPAELNPGVCCGKFSGWPKNT